MAEHIKIIIADDHNLVRQSIALALGSESSFKVVDQAENGKVLLAGVAKHKPDIVVLDLEMPVMNGWETLDHLKKDYPDCKVIVVSMHFEGLLIKDLVQRGARGFLPKNSEFDTLINAIHDVNTLGYFFSNKISSALVKELLMDDVIHPSFRPSRLTGKELETLQQICNDKLTKEIASALRVSERTVERYKTCLYEKTKSKTSAGLVLYALKHNLFSLSK